MLKSFALAVGVSVVALSGVANAKPTAPTIEQLAAYPKMSGFSLSPDGKHMAALEGRGEDRVILVWDTANLKAAPTVISATQMKIQQVFFVKNDVLAVSLWQPYDARFDGVVKTFVGKFFLTDLAGKSWHEPLPLPRPKTEDDERIQAISSPTLLDTLPNDPDHILVVNSVGDDSGDIFKVNVRTFRSEKIQRSDEKTSGYITDLEGNVRARTKFDVDGSGSFIATQIRDVNSTTWSEHFRSRVKDRDVFRVIGFTNDPNIALIESNVGEDKLAIYEYDIAARKRGEVLFKHRFFEASGVSVFPFKGSQAEGFGEITSLHYDGPREDEVVWTSPAFKALDAGVRSALKLQTQASNVVDPATGATSSVKYDTGLGYKLIDYSADLKTAVVGVSGSNAPYSYYLMKDGQLNLMAKAYPSLTADVLGQTKLVYYKARDGLDIPAFLTTPSAALCGSGPFPAVVHPHGGPWGRDNMDFDGSMWVPLMSSRCIAVLQPQFRGSLGWGRKLWKAGDAEWGQKMQDDKDDGAKWLLDQKIAIPGRMAMFGFSYGGYSAMAAAIRPNGLYKCAIAGAGVADIKKIWSRFYTNPFFRDNQRATVDGLNPVDHADQIKIPIMVYHGERDRTVPIEQSRWYVAKAKKSGQKVEYHELADYAHGPAWTRKIMAEQLGYIDTYLTKGCGGGGL